MAARTASRQDGVFGLDIAPIVRPESRETNINMGHQGDRGL